MSEEVKAVEEDRVTTPLGGIDMSGGEEARAELAANQKHSND